MYSAVQRKYCGNHILDLVGTEKLQTPQALIRYDNMANSRGDNPHNITTGSKSKVSMVVLEIR